MVTTSVGTPPLELSRSASRNAVAVQPPHQPAVAGDHEKAAVGDGAHREEGMLAT